MLSTAIFFSRDKAHNGRPRAYSSPATIQMFKIKDRPLFIIAFYFSMVILGLWGAKTLAQEPSIILTGADDALALNVTSHVTLPNLACEATNQRLARLLPSIRQQVVRAGRGLGYYGLTQQTSIRRENECWQLIINLVPGEPVIIASTEVELASDREAFAAILSDLPLKAGDQLDQGKYERIKTRLSSNAIEQGYFSARFKSAELRLDLQRNTADVAISFDPGPRFAIGDLTVNDTDFLAPEFIARYIELSPGDPYSSEALLSLRNTLNDSLYFTQVTVTPELSQAEDNNVPISVNLALRPQRAYSLGAGVTTDIGPRLRADYENRYLTRAGHRIDANGGASPIRSNLDMRYSIPLEKPATESLVFSTGLLSEDTDSFRSETFKLAAAYNFNTFSNWRQSNFIDFQHDDFEISGNRDSSDLLIAGVSLNRTEADDVLYPTKGWRMFAQLRGATADVLSPESFAQLNLAGKYVSRFGPGRVLLKAEMGTTVVDDISNLPISIQYFAGGDQSVRGYKYQTLGPSDADGNVIGGKHLFSAGIEYDFSIMPDWKLAIFSDVGNAFDDYSDFQLNKSVGLGIRWLSPIGPIRVDLASALDDDNDLRVHITMGPDL